MKRLGIIACVIAVLMPSLMTAKEISLVELSKRVADKGMTYVDLGDYKGSVYLQGLTELAFASGPFPDGMCGEGRHSGDCGRILERPCAEHVLPR